MISYELHEWMQGMWMPLRRLRRNEQGHWDVTPSSFEQEAAARAMFLRTRQNEPGTRLRLVRLKYAEQILWENPPVEEEKSGPCLKSVI